MLAELVDFCELFPGTTVEYWYDVPVSRRVWIAGYLEGRAESRTASLKNRL